MPLVPAARIEPSVPAQSIVIDFVIVTAPKPPGSIQLISPAAAVLEIAPAKVLQGAVRLHGLASSPTPETHVRVAWALAGAAARIGARNVRKVSNKMRRMINLLERAGLPPAGCNNNLGWFHLVKRATCVEEVSGKTAKTLPSPREISASLSNTRISREQ